MDFRDLLPAPLLSALRACKQRAHALAVRGEGRYCPVCRISSKWFGPMGVDARPDACCLQCGALERHRLLWLFLQRRPELIASRTGKMLHVAPEPVLAAKFKRLYGAGYVSGDLGELAAMVRMDVTKAPFRDGAFDALYCSHVLEHVPDDAAALRELRRVLRPEGWGIILVPITAERTIEDPEERDPAERLRRFGQEDHVRRYGPDYVERLEVAGFAVETVRPEQFLEPVEIETMGITRHAGFIYLCRPVTSSTNFSSSTRSGSEDDFSA